MKSILLLASFLQLALSAPKSDHDASTTTSKGLVVDTTPQTLRPYVLRKGDGEAVIIGNQVYRFSVSGNSSANAFTLLQTNAPSSGNLGVLPHIHKTHYENFYCTNGRIQLWAQTNATGEAARVLTPGDYGAVPHNTIHTFQPLDPDTQITGVIQPGGFEELFVFISNSSYSSSTGAAFDPSADEAGAGGDPDFISRLEDYDVYAQLQFNPRRDLVNGTAGGSGHWHDGSNDLAPDTVTPNFIAKGYGPQYLNTLGGGYQVIAPLAGETQTAGNFSMGTVTLSPILSSNMTALAYTLPQPVAFQLEEGGLEVKVGGYGDAVTLIQGDVVFVPAKTQFSFRAVASFTKFLYVSGGKGGFDEEILEGAVDWDSSSYPTYFGYKSV